MMGSFGFSAPQRVCVVLEVPVLRPQVFDGFLLGGDLSLVIVESCPAV